jgi:hypothetical protein
MFNEEISLELLLDEGYDLDAAGLLIDTVLYYHIVSNSILSRYNYVSYSLDRKHNGKMSYKTRHQQIKMNNYYNSAINGDLWA